MRRLQHTAPQHSVSMYESGHDDDDDCDDDDSD